MIALIAVGIGVLILSTAFALAWKMAGKDN